MNDLYWTHDKHHFKILNLSINVYIRVSFSILFIYYYFLLFYLELVSCEIQIRQNTWFLNSSSTWDRSRFMIYKHGISMFCVFLVSLIYINVYIYISAMLVMDMWSVLHSFIWGKNFSFAVKWVISTSAQRHINNKNCRSPFMLKIPSFCQLTASLFGKCLNLSKDANNLA